jgi:hypothetical protein
MVPYAIRRGIIRLRHRACDDRFVIEKVHAPPSYASTGVKQGIEKSCVPFLSRKECGPCVCSLASVI